MNLKKIFSVNHILCAASIVANAASTILACRAVKKKKDWKSFIFPTSLFLTGSAATIALTVRGDKSEAKIAVLTTAIATLESYMNTYQTAVENVYGEESQPLVHHEIVEMAGKTVPERHQDKDICWIGYGYNDYLLLSRDDREQIEFELNKILRTEGSVSVAHFFDLCKEKNVIDDVIVNANIESRLYGWDTVMVGRRGYITIREEVYNDGTDDISYLDFDIRPSMSFREDEDICPWEE